MNTTINYTDSAGESWTLKLTVSAIERIRAEVHRRALFGRRQAGPRRLLDALRRRSQADHA
jgi:hypothetical protein